MYKGADFSYSLLTSAAKVKPCYNFWISYKNEMPVLDESMIVPDLTDGNVLWKRSDQIIHFLARSSAFPLFLLMQLSEGSYAVTASETKDEWTTSMLPEEIMNIYKGYLQVWQALLETE
jgi:hypothetical protein